VTSGRAELIWGLVAGQAARRRERVSAVDVCAGAVQALPVSGAWVIAQDAAGAGHPMCVTDAVSEQLAELQMTLGEGPCVDVMASGSPALASDLDDGDAARRWPGFTPQACQANAAAIFALPLRIGAIRAGALGLYRDEPGPLSSFQFGDALILADAAVVGVGIGEAFVRLRAHAYAQDRRLSDVARDIVARRLRLSLDGDLPRDSER
jgi:hypothetical protein